MEEQEVKLQPIPQLEHYVCMSCGNTHVSEVGNQVLCQSCVNTFLARNVGLMRPVREVQAEQDAAAKAAELEAEKAKAGGKKKASRKKVQSGGTG